MHWSLVLAGTVAVFLGGTATYAQYVNPNRSGSPGPGITTNQQKAQKPWGGGSSPHDDPCWSNYRRCLANAAPGEGYAQCNGEDATTPPGCK